MRKSYSRFKNIRIISEITASQLGFAIFFLFLSFSPLPPIENTNLSTQREFGQVDG